MLNVTVILVDHNYTSTAIGPIEVLHSAGTLWHALRGEPPQPRFAITIAAVRDQPVTSAYGLQMRASTTIANVGRTDLVIVPACGIDLDGQFARHAPLMPWLRQQAMQGAYVAGICTGAAFLAEAGLLDGREATTHWATAETLRRRYPKVNWRPERLITEDRRVLCSGGVYSSMDLSLYLVEKFCGREIALQCTKALIVDMPRASQSGYAVLPLSPPHDDAKVRAAEAYIARNFAQDISIEALARSLNMSPRNFIRRFKTATGQGPGSYLQALRVALAKEMLEEGARPVQMVSEAVGYADAQFFRAVFKRCTGMTPGDYRESFGGGTSPARRNSAALPRPAQRRPARGAG